MRTRVQTGLLIGSCLFAASWAVMNVREGLAPRDISSSGFVGAVSSAFGLNLVLLIVLLLVNLSLTSFARQRGRLAQRCRVSHFWVTVGYVGIAVWSEVWFRRAYALGGESSFRALVQPPLGLVVMGACFLPIQAFFGGCVLAFAAGGRTRRTPPAA